MARVKQALRECQAREMRLREAIGSEQRAHGQNYPQCRDELRLP